MTQKTQSLYRELLLEHGKRPHNEGPLHAATHEASAYNPLCGDRVTLRFRVQSGRIEEVHFEARGCMICRASASLLTDSVSGRSVEHALGLAADIDGLVET